VSDFAGLFIQRGGLLRPRFLPGDDGVADGAVHGLRECRHRLVDRDVQQTDIFVGFCRWICRCRIESNATHPQTPDLGLA
jgi:hypothetical protein